MTDDEIYQKFVTIRDQMATEYKCSIDDPVLHYQAVLQTSYYYAGTKDLMIDELQVCMLIVNRIVRSIKVH